MRKVNRKIKERRKKRQFIPVIYFILELMFIWLLLSLLQVNFKPMEWQGWSLSIMFLFGLYALFKMINIYNRQESYSLKDS